MAVVTFNRLESLNINCQGEVVGNPVYELINTDTNITSTFSLNKDFVLRNDLTLSSAITDPTFLKLSNSIVNKMTLTKIVTPENYPRQFNLEFTTDLKIVYDWETITGEQVTEFQIIGEHKFAYVTSNTRINLNANFCYPGIELVYSGINAYKIFKIYLNNKATFTTTRAQFFNVYFCLENGWQGFIRIPIVRTAE